MTRIGAVSYLNTKPLIYGLQARLPRASIEFDLPSRLADRLSSGSLDVALIPSVEFLRSERAEIVSDACIACRGRVRSVQILFRKPPGEVQTLALDEGSRTSAVLGQVLLQKQFGVSPRLCQLSINDSFQTIDADAVLVIGDRAMDLDLTGFVESWDLGERWYELTGLPFVFAMWVASGPATSDSASQLELSAALQASRDAGCAAAAELAQLHHRDYAISQRDCFEYFTEQLHFQLGTRELSGLSLFRDWAAELNLIPSTSQQLSLEPT